MSEAGQRGARLSPCTLIYELDANKVTTSFEKEQHTNACNSLSSRSGFLADFAITIQPIN